MSGKAERAPGPGVATLRYGVAFRDGFRLHGSMLTHVAPFGAIRRFLSGSPSPTFTAGLWQARQASRPEKVAHSSCEGTQSPFKVSCLS
jgi:hypothetical protein